MEPSLQPFFPNVDLPPIPESSSLIATPLESPERCIRRHLESGQPFWVTGVSKITGFDQDSVFEGDAAFMVSFLMQKHGWLSGWYMLFNHPAYPEPEMIRTDLGSYELSDLPLPDLATFGIGVLSETYMYRDLHPEDFKRKAKQIFPMICFAPMPRTDWC